MDTGQPFKDSQPDPRKYDRRWRVLLGRVIDFNGVVYGGVDGGWRKPAHRAVLDVHSRVCTAMGGIQL